MHSLVYDVKLKRPACAILQVLFNGDVGIAGRFPSEDWLVNPTPDMKCYLITDEQLSELVSYHRNLHRSK